LSNRQKIKKEVSGLGDLRHAVIKFKDNSAFLLTRDGYIIKIEDGSVKNKVKVGESSVGFELSDNIIAVANYEPKSVVLLDSKNMKIIKELQTSSRAVGIKSYKDKIIFSLIDKNQVCIYNLKNGEIKKINLDGMPFDAFLYLQNT
jgi:protein NirF